MTLAPLQTTAEPGGFLVLLTFLGVAVAVLLSLVVAVKGVQGYRRSRDPALAGLATGILLLSGAPLVLNVALASLGVVSPATVSVLADLVKLLGLTVILYVIYRT